MVLGGDSTLGRALLRVELASLDGEMLADLGVGLWDLLEDEGLVLNHCEWCLLFYFLLDLVWGGNGV